MKCNAWKEKKKAKKKKASKRKKIKDEWGTKYLDQLCGIKWATQWKLGVEKCAK